MSALTTQFCTVLREDPVLTQHTGERIYNNRPLKSKGSRAMPEAFDENGRVKFSIVVMDDGGMGDLTWDNVTSQDTTVWIHGPMTPEIRELMNGVAYERILALLDHEYTITNGTGIELDVSDRFGVQENPTIANSYVDYLRFSATRLWR